MAIVGHEGRVRSALSVGRPRWRETLSITDVLSALTLWLVTASPARALVVMVTSLGRAHLRPGGAVERVIGAELVAEWCRSVRSLTHTGLLPAEMVTL